LPAEIGRRTKQPYRAPDSAAFRASAAPYIEAALSERALTEGGMFNPRAVAGLREKLSREGLRSYRDNTAFVGVLSAQIWAERFSVSSQTNQSQAA